MHIQQAIDDLAAGKIIILLDDDDRENEGDFIQAARHVSAQSVNFMVTHGKGLLCQALTAKRAQELDLGLQTPRNTALHGTAFTVSVDYVHGTGTGISASDRAKTIAALEAAATKPTDLARPGHVFPIVAQNGGVLVRRGHTEAAVDLVQLANSGSSAAICEILNEEGSAATKAQLEDFAKRHGLTLVHLSDLVSFLQKR